MRLSVSLTDIQLAKTYRRRGRGERKKRCKGEVNRIEAENEIATFFKHHTCSPYMIKVVAILFRRLVNIMRHSDTGESGGGGEGIDVGAARAGGGDPPTNFNGGEVSFRPPPPSRRKVFCLCDFTRV